MSWERIDIAVHRGTRVRGKWVSSTAPAEESAAFGLGSRDASLARLLRRAGQPTLLDLRP
ncbi:hypothetical protein GCM10025786_08070 [Nocardioides caeni]